MRLSEDDEQSVRDVTAAQVAAWNRGDLNGFLNGYLRSEDIVFTAGGAVFKGFGAMRARYVERYGVDQTRMGTLAIEIVQVQGLGADGALVLGRWRVDTSERRIGGMCTLALERQDDTWRIVHDHTSMV